HQAEHHVVGSGPLTEEGAGTGRHLDPGVATGDRAGAQHQVLERQGEDQRDDPGEDHAERPPHRHPAEQPTDEGGAEGREDQGGDDRHADPIGEEGGAVAAHPGEGADAEEQLSGAAEDQVEADGVAGEGQAEDRHAHPDPGVADPQRHRGQHRAHRGDRPEQPRERPGDAGLGPGDERRPGGDGPAAHSRTPKSPVGRITIVIAAATSRMISDRNVPMYELATLLIIPSTSPARNAPGMLPRPPTTVTIRPSTVRENPARTFTGATIERVIATMAARTPLNTRISRIINCGSMPTSRDPSSSWITDRMARPRRV